MPALLPPPPDNPETLDTLHRIVREMTELAARNAVLGADYAAARALGERALAAYGEPGMLYAFGALSLAYGQGLIRDPSPSWNFHPQDFYLAWDGIGPWRA